MPQVTAESTLSCKNFKSMSQTDRLGDAAEALPLPYLHILCNYDSDHHPQMSNRSFGCEYAAALGASAPILEFMEGLL
jgi:hypothetical protein